MCRSTPGSVPGRGFSSPRAPARSPSPPRTAAARPPHPGGSLSSRSHPSSPNNLSSRRNPNSRRNRRPVADQEAPTGTQLLELVKVMDRLRSPGGCPWDAEQTHQSLATYLVEETYETLEAIEKGDDADLREELGDLLLQVVFHARIGQEHPDSPWSIDDVAGDIVAKLVRRHPHVFATGAGTSAPSAAELNVRRGALKREAQPRPPAAAGERLAQAVRRHPHGFATDAGTSAPSAEELNGRGEAMEREEKQRTSAVEGVPLAQPALSLAAKVFHRVEQARLPVTTPEIDLPEMTSADDVGDVLLAVASRVREIGVDAEQALRTATRRYIDQVQAAEGGSPP